MVKKKAKNLDEIAKKIQTKKIIGWNHHIVTEKQIVDMWYSLSNMWMNFESWSTTTKFYIVIVALLKKWKKEQVDNISTVEAPFLLSVDLSLLPRIFFIF